MFSSSLLYNSCLYVQVHELVEAIETLITSVANGAIFQGASIGNEADIPSLNMVADALLQPSSGWSLMRLRNEWSKYAGTLAPSTPRLPINLLDVPRVAPTLAAAIAAMSTCERVCLALLERARDGNLSSRLVLQYEILELITELFTATLPLPVDVYTATVAAAPPATTGCIWAEPLPREKQLSALQTVSSLTTIYGLVSQVRVSR